MHRELPSGSLLPCLLDCQGGGVDPPHFMPFPCKEKGMLPCSASYVQDRSGDLSPSDQLNELFLGPANIPRRYTLICRVKEIHTSPSLHQGLSNLHSPLFPSGTIQYQNFPTPRSSEPQNRNNRFAFGNTGGSWRHRFPGNISRGWFRIGQGSSVIIPFTLIDVSTFGTEINALWTGEVGAELAPSMMLFRHHRFSHLFRLPGFHHSHLLRQQKGQSWRD
jgi:hypothetical protein